MREAVIIMPRDNPQASAHLRLLLLDRFGGYTQHEAAGAWRDPAGKVLHDHHNVFTVACDVTFADVERMQQLRVIAAAAGREANQQCVYLRGFNGVVELVPCM